MSSPTPNPVTPTDAPASPPAPAPTAPPPATAVPSPARCLTLRALLLALLFTFGCGLVAHYHDGIIIHYDISQHNYLTPLALAALFLFLLGGNALLRLLGPRAALSAGELGVVLALTLVTAPLARFVAAPWVASVGYTRNLVATQHAQVKPLQTANPYDALPPQALLSPEASRLFDNGLVKDAGALASPATVPWHDWLQPLLYWTPLLLCFLAMCIALGYTLQRQWAERELVPFPIAEFGAALLRHDQQRRFPDIFYDRRFWFGFGCMAIIFLINGIHLREPKMIEIPTKFQFYDLANSFPFLKNSREGYSLLRGWMYFAVISVAVLLPSELSFTAWFTWPMMVVLTYFYYLQTGRQFSGQENGSLQIGAYWAMAAVILYTGRSYYLALFRRACGWRRGERDAAAGIDREAVWLCRILLLATVLWVLLLTWYGVPLDLAVLWTIAALVFFLVTCRLVAEMGIPWTPLNGTVGPLPTLLISIGERTLGARGFALLSVLGNVFVADKTTSLLLVPAAANAAHVESRLTGRRASLRLLAPFLALMLAVAAATAIWLGYSCSGDANDYQFQMRYSTGTAQSLAAMFPPGSGQTMSATLATNRGFLERWRDFRVDPKFPPFFVIGASLVLATAAARLRFPRFPLHPLPLVLLGSWLMSRYWFSFMLGWLIKCAIIKIGGGRLFEHLRPFFIGTVVGLCVMYAFWILMNIVTYCSNGFTFQLEWPLLFRDMFSS